MVSATRKEPKRGHFCEADTGIKRTTFEFQDDSKTMYA